MLLYSTDNIPIFILSPLPKWYLSATERLLRSRLTRKRAQSDAETTIPFHTDAAS